MKGGDFTELEQFWKRHLEREGGTYTIERLNDGIRLVVTDCPAMRHLVKLGQNPDPIMCKVTQIFNSALAEGSDFRASFKQINLFSCEQCFQCAKPEGTGLK